MKRLLLPKNKFARLGINIFIVVFWFLLFDKLFVILWNLFADYVMNNNYDLFLFLLRRKHVGYIPLLYYILFLIPSFLISRLIWFGRILPKPKITRSKD